MQWSIHSSLMFSCCRTTSLVISSDSLVQHLPVLTRQAFGTCDYTYTMSAESEDANTRTTAIASGIYNLGNSCYLGSALCALGHCMPLVELMTNVPHKMLMGTSATPSKSSIPRSLAAFLNEMWCVWSWWLCLCQVW